MLSPLSATRQANSRQVCCSPEREVVGQEHHRGDVMTIKSVVVPLEVEYLQAAARERGISRTKLVRIVMEKVVRDELVSKILSDDDLVAEPAQQRYRRFRNQR